MNIMSLIKYHLTSLVIGLILVSVTLKAFSDPTADPSGYSANDSVLIFVSFSMPPASLTQWFNQAEKIQAPIVIRGLVDQSFQKTQTQVHALLKEGSGGFILDPRLFEQYQINQVPAVIVRDTSASCLPNQSCIYPYDVVYGDVSLEYALQTIAQQGENAAVAQNLLQKMRENAP